MKLRKFFRRTAFVLLLLCSIWVLTLQTGCFSMRTPDKTWVKKLKEQSQSIEPIFLDLPDRAGRKIHAVCIQASDTLPLVVFLHGSPGASDAFVDYLADTSLSKKARLVALDRPGFGYTDNFGKPEPSMAAQADAVLAIVQALSPQQKVILVGHSLGGPVIARFAMDYPERTAGLVFVAGSIDPRQEEHPWWQTAVDIPPLKWLIPKVFWASNAEIIPLENELDQMLPLWTKITCPVRILHATDDQLVPIANVDFARKMLVNCPDLKVEVLPEGDHFILWSQPQKVKDMIESLLK